MTKVGTQLLSVLRPIRDRRADEAGRCSVCGFAGRFAANSWMLPRHAADEFGRDWVESFMRRESLFCRRCASSLRVRRVAEVLLEHYGEGAESILDLVEQVRFRELDLVEINAVGAIHAFLQRLPRLRYSEYSRGGEDIQALSYGDASFDLVLTSDTLEHVPDWQRALAETRRVLRLGGRHIFTVPLVPGRPHTEDVSRNAWYHDRGTGAYALLRRKRDYKVYSVFGADLLDTLRGLGFEPELHFSDAASVLCARAV